MLNKKAFEVSINFIVVLIISLLVFVFGLYITNKFFGQAEAVKRDIDLETRQQIEKLLDDGSRVAIPLNRRTIRRGHSDTFGMGILNVLGGSPTIFTVKVGFDAAYEINNSNMSGANGGGYIDQEWIFSDPQNFTIKNREKETVPIYVKVGGSMSSSPELTTREGTYVFNAYVCDDIASGDSNCDGSPASELYDGHVHKIYVEVS
jgi:hypothetical protein